MFGEELCLVWQYEDGSECIGITVRRSRLMRSLIPRSRPAQGAKAEGQTYHGESCIPGQRKSVGCHLGTAFRQSILLLGLRADSFGACI